MPVDIVSKGDVYIHRTRMIRPMRPDFFLVEFHCWDCETIVPMLFGDKKIGIKFWKDQEGNGNPTIVETGLRWKTFDGDDNILVMIKKAGHEITQSVTILITKKFEGI